MGRHEYRLKKELSLRDDIFYGVGIIIGAGIFVLLGKGAGLAGNSVWLSFIIAAVMAAFTGLSYCELSSRYPDESAEYIYTRKAFRLSALSFIIGWVLI
ncbi:MAG: amino acid permease, partial [Candidatus Aenigmarchaeota archaeon]|nr:amino acid permease [Candidatus Aenigmarchaeota archaeon]